MEKKSNSRASKIKVNSLEHFLFEDLIDQEVGQIRGGHFNNVSLYLSDCIAPSKEHKSIEPFIVIVSTA